MRVSDASLPARLRGNGYRTGLIGKWHLGIKREYSLNAHGFDEFFGFLGGSLDYYTHTDPMGVKRHDLYQDTLEVQSSKYITDEITDRATQFINTNKSTPFFLEVAYNATHWPFQPPDLPPGQRNRFGSILPGDTTGATRADYVKMLERMDAGIGKILVALDSNGLTRNTLVIFTNDNGGEWLSRNQPFFNGKGTLWEGGIRVPLVMRWPNRIPLGQSTSQVAVTMDLTATVLSATETQASSALPPDGIDLLPVIADRRPPIDRTIFWRLLLRTRNQRVVRSGPWKLMLDGEWGMLGTAENIHVMLFDLRTDTGERNDLASQQPARVAQLLSLIEKWDREVPIRRRP